MDDTARTILLIAGVVVLMAGVPLSIVFFAFRSIGKQQRLAREAARSWPSTSGEIVQSRVETIDGFTSVAKVWYAYSVAGKTYENDKLWVVPPREFEPARATVDRYPKGRTVVVYYNPVDPQQAALER